MDTSEGHQNCEYIVRAREAVEPEFIAISNKLGTHGCKWQAMNVVEARLLIKSRCYQRLENVVVATM
jgi:hypothetical protein